MKIQLFTHQWVGLPQELKIKLINLFGIKKSGVVEVANRPTGSVVLSDGFTNENLAAITVEKMQEILGSEETDFYTLFEKLEIKLKDEISAEKKAQEAAIPKEPEPLTAENLARAIKDLSDTAEDKEVIVKKVSKRRGRPAKV